MTPYYVILLVERIFGDSSVTVAPTGVWYVTGAPRKYKLPSELRVIFYNVKNVLCINTYLGHLSRGQTLTKVNKYTNKVAIDKRWFLWKLAIQIVIRDKIQKTQPLGHKK